MVVVNNEHVKANRTFAVKNVPTKVPFNAALPILSKAVFMDSPELVVDTG